MSLHFLIKTSQESSVITAAWLPYRSQKRIKYFGKSFVVLFMEEEFSWGCKVIITIPFIKWSRKTKMRHKVKEWKLVKKANLQWLQISIFKKLEPRKTDDRGCSGRRARPRAAGEPGRAACRASPGERRAAGAGPCGTGKAAHRRRPGWWRESCWTTRPCLSAGCAAALWACPPWRAWRACPGASWWTRRGTPRRWWTSWETARPVSGDRKGEEKYKIMIKTINIKIYRKSIK